MQLETQITYRWWPNNTDQQQIPEAHAVLLHEAAQGHIPGLLSEGCLSGELVFENDDQCSYRGWWEINTKEN